MKKIQKIEEFVKRYQEYYKNNEILDFYDFFELDRDVDFNELIDFIKNEKIRAFFHSDHSLFLSEQYRSDYLELVKKVTAIVANDFSNPRNRELYDAKLKDYNQKKRAKVLNEEQTKQSDEMSNNKSDKDKMNEAIKTQILKYGFNSSISALHDFLFNDYVLGFTTDNGTRNKIKNLGVQKIFGILEGYGTDEDKTNYSKLFVYYLTDLVNQDLKDNGDVYQILSCYIKACTETIFKYHQIPGREYQGLGAIQSFIKNGEVGKFTNNNNVRVLLSEKVNPSDGKILTYVYLTNFREYYPECEWDNLLRMSDNELGETLEMFLKSQMNLENNFHDGRGR